MAGTMNMGASTRQPMDANAGSNQPMDTGESQKPMGRASGGGQPVDAGSSAQQRQDAGSSNEPMANGGGPEPHQGDNPGAQSDPGPKEIGYYDLSSGHMGGDDGVQNAAERPSPMRMGGVDGSQPNAGQRGGQNTGTSGSQTTNEFSQPQPAEPGGASMMAGSTAEIAAGGGAHNGYYSRAASQVADDGASKGGMAARTSEPAESFESTPAARGSSQQSVMDKAKGFAGRAKDQAEMFFNVDFDNDGVVGTDPHPQKTSETYGGNAAAGGGVQSAAEMRSTDSQATGLRTAPVEKPDSPKQVGPAQQQPGQQAQQPESAMEPKGAMEPEAAMEPQSAKEPGMPQPGQQATQAAKTSGKDVMSNGGGKRKRPASLDYSTSERSVMRTDGVSRTDAQQREKEQAVA